MGHQPMAGAQLAPSRGSVSVLKHRSHHSRARSLSCRAQLTRAADSSTAVTAELVDTLQQQLQQVQQLQLPDSEQSLQAVQQYSSQAATAAAAAWSSLISPFAVFGDAWLLNFLFFSSISLLVYSLLILAPRQ